ncbi:Predicted Fe-Mo cluster-binding protein, NifX family [Oscillospiraceae bacterium]|nr:Predicted Fe-Mo cluster-binding protein, NifX family [Oscillospiraceae bacterium]
MVDESFKIAVASSDGVVVNKHFGKSKVFRIYTVDEDEKLHFEEERHVTPVCEGGEHDEDRLDQNLQVLSDCKYLLVARIGSEAYLHAERFGIQSYELPGLIEESIDRLIKFIKIQNLFTKKG